MTDGIPAAPGTEGWFREGPEGFALIAGRCTECGSLAFPPRPGFGCPDPDCDGLESEPAALSTTGTLWSYTDARYAPPPPYPRPVEGAEFTPYTVAAVELAAERMVVLGQVVPGVETGNLSVGMRMELVHGILTASDGTSERVWNWRPAVSASSASVSASSSTTAGGAR